MHSEPNQLSEANLIHLSQIVHGMAIPAFVIDKDHVVVHWNKACEKLTGIPSSEMIGTRNAWRAFYSTKRPVLADLIVERSAENQIERYYDSNFAASELVDDAYEAHGFFPHLGKGGKWLYFTATPIKDASNNPIGAIETFQDITDRKRAEEVLRESEEKLRQITSSAQDAIVMIDDRGLVNFWNESAEQIFGYSREEIFGKEMHAILAPPALLKSYQATFLNFEETGKGPNLGKIKELSAIRKDGTEFPIELSLSAVRIRGSWNAIGIIRDITRRKEAEAARERMDKQLQQSEKMAAIGTLAGGIAHDFNNILSAILGYSELALADLPVESALRNKLEGIHSSGARARDLVEQILAFSRKEEQVMSSVAMHLMIEDALKLLRPAIPKTIDINARIETKCCVLGNPSRIHRIVMNLCTNAYQAMAEHGGKIDILLSEKELTGQTSAMTQLPPGKYAELVVSDTGVGIPSENISRIFDPYFTTKEKGKGTGLGLATVHGMVKSHGGAVLVESQMNRGTTFTVYLPTAQGLHTTSKQAESTLTGGKERILLIDDESAILEIEKEMLEKLGYAVTETNDAKKAIELFSSQPHEFDLVITDMAMPQMTGEEVSHQIRNLRPDISILICTGFSEVMSKEKAESMGINGFLMKPVSLKDLSNTVRDSLDEEKKSIRSF